MIRDLLSTMPYTVTFSVLVGVLAAPAGQSLWATALAVYDEQRPVVQMAVQIVGREGAAVMISVRGTKMRKCKYLRVQAYARSANGDLFDAYATRVDRQEDGSTKPVGSYNIGVWRIWPVEGAASALMFVQHDCDGRVVVTKIAEVNL